MTDENLQNLPLEALYTRMVKAIQELKLINDSPGDPGAYKKKREEIKFIHSLIETRRKEAGDSVNHNGSQN